MRKIYQLILPSFLLLLPLAVHTSWDVEYVTTNLVLPTAKQTQELLYCICEQCMDEKLDEMLKRTQQDIMHPQLVLTRPEDNLIELRFANHKRNLYTVVMTRSNHDHDLVFEVQDRILRGRRMYLSLVIMHDSIANFSLVVEVLRKLHGRKYVNTDVYYHNATSGDNEVFGFTYYPQFAVINRTHLVDGDLGQTFYYRAYHTFDVQGYVFSSPIVQDPPKVIKYTDRWGRSRVQGTCYSILNLFVNYINGTFQEWNSSKALSHEVEDMHDVLDLVRGGEIELSVHAYELMPMSENTIEVSYPLNVVNWCLMVPITNSVFTMFYPFLPFESPVWLMLVWNFILYNCINYLWLKRGQRRTHNFLLKNFCQFLNITPPYFIPAGTGLDMFINSCCFVYGYFLSAFYSSILGSILTVTIVRKQINSMADLIAAQLPVMMIDYEMEFLLTGTFILPKAFVDLLRPTNYSDYNQHQFALNTSFAYFVTDNLWHLLNEQQQYSHRRSFKFTNICFGSYHQAFPMEYDSPIWRDLEYFLFRIHSSGLFYYYESKTFDYAVRAGLVRRLTDYHAVDAVGMQQLWIVFSLLVAFLFLATVCFVVEYSHQRLNKKCS